jgi:hypothetical protein
MKLKPIDRWRIIALLIGVLLFGLAALLVGINERSPWAIYIAFFSVFVTLVADQIILMFDGHPERVVSALKDVRELIERRNEAEGTEVLHTGDWEIKTIQTLLKGANDGEEVKIWITFFDDDQLWNPIKCALDNGATVNILMH